MGAGARGLQTEGPPSFRGGPLGVETWGRAEEFLDWLAASAKALGPEERDATATVAVVLQYRTHQCTKSTRTVCLKLMEGYATSMFQTKEEVGTGVAGRCFVM